jgi:Protein of unknown function (DUF4244)
LSMGLSLPMRLRLSKGPLALGDIHSLSGVRSAINRFRQGRTISAGVMRLPMHPIGCSTRCGCRPQGESMSIENTATMSDQVVPVVEADSPSDSTELVRRDERGMVSAEWAVGIIAAVAIAGVLLAIITNGQVEAVLLKFILMVINSFSGFLK